MKAANEAAKKRHGTCCAERGSRRSNGRPVPTRDTLQKIQAEYTKVGVIESTSLWPTDAPAAGHRVCQPLCGSWAYRPLPGRSLCKMATGIPTIGRFCRSSNKINATGTTRRRGWNGQIVQQLKCAPGEMNGGRNARRQKGNELFTALKGRHFMLPYLSITVSSSSLLPHMYCDLSGLPLCGSLLLSRCPPGGSSLSRLLRPGESNGRLSSAKGSTCRRFVVFSNVIHRSKPASTAHYPAPELRSASDWPGRRSPR